jgi:hypothetical protein
MHHYSSFFGEVAAHPFGMIGAAPGKYFGSADQLS